MMGGVSGKTGTARGEKEDEMISIITFLSAAAASAAPGREQPEYRRPKNRDRNPGQEPGREELP